MIVRLIPEQYKHSRYTQSLLPIIAMSCDFLNTLLTKHTSFILFFMIATFFMIFQTLSQQIKIDYELKFPNSMMSITKTEVNVL